MIKGIDVSHYQAGIDWTFVAADGIKFAYAKATDGSIGFDSEFNHHRQGAKDVGLLFGAYHFFRLEEDIVQQAAHFAKALGTVKGELPPMIDVEWDSRSKHYGQGTVMDVEALSRVKAMVALMISHGFNPGIYTNPWFWPSDNVVADGFEDMPLWVPNYHAKDVSEVKIPKPWKKINIWQYSESIKGYGVDKVDGNYFMGTEEELKAIAGASQ